MRSPWLALGRSATATKKKSDLCIRTWRHTVIQTIRFEDTVDRERERARGDSETVVRKPALPEGYGLETNDNHCFTWPSGTWQSLTPMASWQLNSHGHAPQVYLIPWNCRIICGCICSHGQAILRWLSLSIESLIRPRFSQARAVRGYYNLLQAQALSGELLVRVKQGARVFPSEMSEPSWGQKYYVR